MLTRRYGRLQPIVDINTREDGRYAGVQLGLITYSTPDGADEETYQASYLEIGSRVDHVADPLMDLFNVEREELTALTATAVDAARLRKPSGKSADKSVEATA